MPANVKLGPEGRVKVLDFGIAKAVAPAPDESTTDGSPASRVTSAGAVRGTAPYMSPEQVRGQAVDARTDVWAFGCLLYEMLTGRPVFLGASPAEIMAAVLRVDVEWSRLPPGTPAALRRLLRRCLRRSLRERLQDIGDARLELSELGREEGEAVERPGRGRLPFRAVWPGLTGAALVAGLLGVWIGRTSEPVPPRGVPRLSLELPAGLALAHDFATPFAVAPDGSRLVVLATQDGTQRLFLRDLDTLEALPIAGTENAWQPFFSSDGREIAFFAERKLKKVSLEGGPALPLAEIGRNPRGGCWGSDGTLVLAPSARSGLARVSASGGALTPLTRLDLARGEGSHRWPQILPGGRWVLFTASVGETIFDEARIEAVSLETGERRLLLSGGSHGRYAAGRLFFARAGRMFAVSFDPGSLAVRGTPEVVLEGVRYDPRSGATDFALSDDGTLVYSPAVPTSSETYLAWVDEAGNLTRLGYTPRQFREPRLSPDGRRVAARIGTEAESDIWIVDTEGATLSRLSFGRSLHRPVWTPDGRGITVASEHDGRWKLLTLPTTGSGAPVTIFEGPHRVYADAWSHDGRFLVAQELRPATSWDLWVLEVGADGRAVGAPRDIAAMPFEERNAALSPDGRWVAYEADEPDAIAEVYVASLASPGSKVRATVTSARWPRWGAAGQLYYWFPTGRPQGDSDPVAGLHRIEWREEASRPVLKRTVPVWRGARAMPALAGRLVVTPYASYDVDVSRPDPRFLVLETSAAGVEVPLLRPVVVLNWFEDLRARAAPRR